MTIYNSLNALHKKPFGAAKSDTIITFSINVPKEYSSAEPRLCITKFGETMVLLPMQKSGECDAYNTFTLEYKSGTVGIYSYFFDLYTNYQKVFKGEMSEGYIAEETGEEYQLTVYSADFKTPEFFKNAVMYQIFPDRFCEGKIKSDMPFADRCYRENKAGEPYFWPTEQDDGKLNMDYYGGDFAGIESKLDYLKELGVTCIYLNPIFEAHANHRYNTADYMKPDPLLGTIEDFEKMCAAAKNKGIVVVLDGVFSHTGADSVYFNKYGRYGDVGAYKNEDSEYRSWYDFSQDYTHGYRSWWGFESLPEVDENSPSFRNFICGESGVIDYWLQHGASGFRLDVADELPDDFIEDLRIAVKRNGEENLLMGEVWEDATRKQSYGSLRRYLLGGGLDTVMNYPFKDAIIEFVRYKDARKAATMIMPIVENYPKPAIDVAMNFISTHDTMRAITALAGEDAGGRDRYWQSGRVIDGDKLETAKKMLRLALCMIYTLPGIPSIYYGDEIAMQGYTDPFNRGYFDWDNKDDMLRETIKELSETRAACECFSGGGFEIISAENAVFVYRRVGKTSSSIIVINAGDSDYHSLLIDKEIVCGALDFAIISV